MTLISEKNIVGLTYSMAFEEYKLTKNLNLFEEVIDRMMLESFTPEFSAKIMNMPLKDKRMSILSLLDKDRNLFLRIKGLINSGIGKYEHIKDVILMLREYVKVGEVEKKKFGEVMTPLELVKEMLATLPDEVWSNPNLKWLDPANGSGPYPLMVIFRLMNGLKDWEPDEEKRYKHIVEKMIYVCELQPKNMFLYMCAVDPWDIYQLNIYTGSFLESGFDKHMKEVWGFDKFDIVVGNPPYQEEVEGGSQKPLYDKFILKSINISKKVIFITPSRWFSGGKGLDSFRKKMMTRKDIKIINHFDDASKIFGNGIFITGGVSYFLIDEDYNGKTTLNGYSIDLVKFDIIVKNPISYGLIEKMMKFEGIDKICKGQSYSGITTNDKRLSDIKNIDSQIKCYVSKRNGQFKWIDIEHINKSVNLSKWKVILVEATNAVDSGHGKYLSFGNRFIGMPNEICNQSYIVFETNSEYESKSLLSYLNCKLVDYLVSLRKISQHTKPDTCKWVPIVPFDREWTDEKLFEYFGLTEEEKKLII